MLAQRVESFIRGLGRDDGESVHLEKFHQRPAYRHIVFDDEHETGGVFVHMGCPAQYT